MNRLPASFYKRDVLDVAPDLLGKKLVIVSPNSRNSYIISEVEAYKGDNDMACHASKGRTPRTEVMFRDGGVLYIYLIYGIHWMLNIVTGTEGNPQAVLIRGFVGLNGPGRITKKAGIDHSFNAESLINSKRIWVEDGDKVIGYQSGPRIGIDYAGEPWISKPWRFFY